MNVELLRRVQKQILDEPRQFDMDGWFTQSIWRGKAIPNCGTAACIGGWAIALSKRMTPSEASLSTTRIEETASRILDLTYGEAKRLFMFARWPLQFQIQPSNNVKQAVDRIEHFIVTHGND